jgi:hypothetical protein
MTQMACVRFEETVDLVQQLSRVDRLRLLAHMRLAIAVECTDTASISPLSAYRTPRESLRPGDDDTTEHRESRTAFQWDDF